VAPRGKPGPAAGEGRNDVDITEAAARAFDIQVRHPWETARVDVVHRLVSAHVPLAEGAIVLDIGCGDTYVVEQFAARYPQARFQAVDTAFTDEVIGRLAARMREPNVNLFPSLESLPRETSEASLVLLMDVIEHIPDVQSFLEQVRGHRCVGRGTWLLVTVPAHQSLFCSHDRFLGHCRRYSIRQLAASLEQAGLQITETGSFFLSLLLVRAAEVLLERVIGRERQRSTGVVTWQGGRFTSAALRRVLSLDASIALLLKRVGIRLPGLSHYAICRTSA
jgi:trans-aconitate methyltransferase